MPFVSRTGTRMSKELISPARCRPAILSAEPHGCQLENGDKCPWGFPGVCQVTRSLQVLFILSFKLNQTTYHFQSLSPHGSSLPSLHLAGLTTEDAESDRLSFQKSRDYGLEGTYKIHSTRMHPQLHPKDWRTWLTGRIWQAGIYIWWVYIQQVLGVSLGRHGATRIHCVNMTIWGFDHYRPMQPLKPAGWQVWPRNTCRVCSMWNLTKPPLAAFSRKKQNTSIKK